MALSLSEFIKVVYKGGLQIITLSRPQKKNAINGEMYRSLLSLLDYGSKSNEVSFTVLTGEGDFFSSGNDFGLDSLGESLPDTFQKYCDALIDYPKIIIAVVNGPAIGMTFTMLPLFDVVYASKNAFFYAPFSKIGVCAECCSSLTFPRIFGTSKAMEIFAFGHKLTAEEALHYGFISEILTPEQLKTGIWDRLIGYTKLSLNSMMVSKKLARDGERKLLHELNRKENESLGQIMMSEDTINRLMKQFAPKL